MRTKENEYAFAKSELINELIFIIIRLRKNTILPIFCLTYNFIPDTNMIRNYTKI